MELYETIDGFISTFSHIFKFRKGPLFVIELHTYAGFCYIAIRRHLLWHEELKPGFLVRFTELKKVSLLKDFNKPVYEASRTSSLVKLEVVHNPVLQSPANKNKEESISFQGTITAVIDGELGIFKIDQNHTLIISLILDLTVKLYTKDASHHDGERFCLRVGDRITFYNAHYFNENGHIFFVACGRTLLQVQRKLEMNCKCQNSSNVIIHCLHTFNLGKEFLDWLRNLKSVFSSFKLENGDIGDFNERVFYEKFVLENERIQKQTGTRSLLKEFLLHDSNCRLSKGFVKPFELIRLKDLKSKLGKEVPANVIDLPRSTSSWKSSICSNQDKALVLLGHLIESEMGYVKIQDGCQVLDVPFVRQEVSAKSLCPFGVVCITRFSLAHESFMNSSNILRKEYLLVKEDSVTGLSSKPTLERGQDDDALFQLEVIAKSGLSFSPNLQNDMANPYFFVLCRISKYGGLGPLWASSMSLLLFNCDFAKLFPLLSKGSVISGSIPFDLFRDSDFTKTRPFNWFPSLQKCFGTNEVGLVPKSFVVRDISCAKSSLTTPISNLNYRTLQGWVRKKVMVESKHRQEGLPPEMIDAHIGTPEGKTICLLIKEDSAESTTNTWWVHCDYGLNHVKQNILPLYALGVVLNAKVALTWLEPSVTECQMFLKATALTEVIILSFPEIVEEAPKTNDTRYLPLNKVKTMTSGSVVKIRCTISSLLKAVFRISCPSCKSIMVNGTCSFVGCHSKERGTVASYAQIIVEDGTETASVFINNPETLRILLNVKEGDWDRIHCECSFLNDTGELNYSIFRNNQQNLGRFLDSHCKSSRILRPVIIVARIFKKNYYSISKDLLELFCLELRNFLPHVD